MSIISKLAHKISIKKKHTYKTQCNVANNMSVCCQYLECGTRRMSVLLRIEETSIGIERSGLYARFSCITLVKQEIELRTALEYNIITYLYIQNFGTYIMFIITNNSRYNNFNYLYPPIEIETSITLFQWNYLELLWNIIGTKKGIKCMFYD